MKTVIISGNFDPIHVGHLDYFKAAKKLGKVTCILTRDSQIIKKKGYVFMPYEERKEMLEAFGIDVVKNIDNDETCTETLRLLAPKSACYFVPKEWHPEESVCKILKIKLVYDVSRKRQSSSKLVRKMDKLKAAEIKRKQTQLLKYGNKLHINKFED
jgi:cytidyltransferase-like protein